ncbi:MAG: metallophosphoesterase [Methanoregulaceae archaeon]
MEETSPESRYNDTSRYRLDLRLGIPSSRLQGALEWWIGDTGLCRDPDRHPYLVLAEISSGEWGSQHEIMQAVSRSAEVSGPILISVNQVTHVQSEPVVSFYQVFPSPGLRSFVFFLSRICPVTARPGSLADRIACGTPVPFTIVPPLPARDLRAHPHRLKGEKKSSVAIRNKKDQSNLISQLPEEGNGDPVYIEILRICLRKDGLPVAEYDLSQKKWLDASKSYLRKNARPSLRRFRIGKGYQMTRSRFLDEPQIYVISDLHLGHVNSIFRYKRPFLPSDPGEMDRVLIRNWNWTVKENDTVIFLGDLSYMSTISLESYLERLKGCIFYIEGNHDPYYPFMSHCLLMRYRGTPYLFIHNPEELVEPFEGWVIHGHVHNKDLVRYPFFNPHRRTVNVSAEVIGYRPISLDEIHNFIMEIDEVLSFRDLSLQDRISPHRERKIDQRLPGRC